MFQFHVGLIEVFYKKFLKVRLIQEYRFLFGKEIENNPTFFLVSCPFYGGYVHLYRMLNKRIST